MDQNHPLMEDDRAALTAQLSDLVEALQAKMFRVAGPMELPPDLTLQQMRVLGLIARSEGLTINALGHGLGVSAPTATGLVDRLVEKGLVVRREDAADRRVRHLWLTDAGRSTLADLENHGQRMIDRLVPLLSDEELRVLAAGYRVLVAAVDRAPGALGC